MPRFTIRDVLWLTVVVALAVGWWTNRVRLADENHSLVSKNQKLEARAGAAIQIVNKLGAQFVWDRDGAAVQDVRIIKY